MTLVQTHVDEVLVQVLVHACCDSKLPRIREDVFTEILGGQTQVAEGGAKGQWGGQLQEGQVVVMVVSYEMFVDVESLNGHCCIQVT